MTATSEVRFGADGTAKVQSYVRLTDSTWIRCCTYDDAAPILTIHDGPAEIAITNPGRGEVTEEDVRLGRQLAEAVTRYAAELEKHAAKDPPRRRQAPMSPLAGRRDDTADEGGAAGAGTSGRPWVLSRMHERGDQSMRRVVTGEELAQLYNPDPFAMPRWRAPVYRTPFGIILAVKFARLLGWIVRLIFRHPLAASIVALAAVIWVDLGWVALVALVLAAVVMLACWRWFWPVSFSRWVGRPARSKWRAWFYRRRWAAVMTIAGVAPWYQGRTLLPVLGKVAATRYVDRVHGPAGLRPVGRRFRGSCGQPGARVRRDAVPGPVGPVRRGGAGVHPP